MKKIVEHKKYITLSLFAAVCFLCISINASAQIMSDKTLYANGFLNYNNGNWQYAAVYLFAYQQKNPEAFAANPEFKKKLVEAFDHSMKQLANMKSELASFQKAAASKDKSGGGNSQDALTSRPPLPNPTVVETYKRKQ